MKKTWNCSYCFTAYDSPEIDHWIGFTAGRSGYEKGPKRYTCSDACKKRLTIWTRWVQVSRDQSILGDVNKPARVSDLGAGGLAEAITPYSDTIAYAPN